MIGLIILSIFIVSTAACMAYDIRNKSDRPTYVRAARGLVMGVVTGLCVTVVLALLNIALLLIQGY